MQPRKNECLPDPICKNYKVSDLEVGDNILKNWDSSVDFKILRKLLIDLYTNKNISGISIFEKSKGSSNIFGTIRFNLEKIPMVVGWRTDVNPIDPKSEGARKKINAKYNEYRTACTLAKQGIAPQVFFFVAVNLEDGKNISTKIFEFMEAYESDLKSLFLFYGNDYYVNEASKQLENHFTNLAGIGYYCVDIKPDNAVWRRIKDNKIEIKLIDWDNHFCNSQILSELGIDKEDLKYTMMVLFVISCLTLIPINFDKKKIPLYTTVKKYFKNCSNYSNIATTLKLKVSDCHSGASVMFHYYLYPCPYEDESINDVHSILFLLLFIFNYDEKYPDRYFPKQIIKGFENYKNIILIMLRDHSAEANVNIPKLENTCAPNHFKIRKIVHSPTSPTLQRLRPNEKLLLSDYLPKESKSISNVISRAPTPKPSPELRQAVPKSPELRLAEPTSKSSELRLAEPT